MAKKKKSAKGHTYLLENIPFDLWTRLERSAAASDESVRAYILNVLDLYVNGYTQRRVALRVQLERARASLDYVYSKI